MTTIYSGYDKPSVVRLVITSGTTMTSDPHPIIVVNYGDSLSLHPVWISSYVGAQVQYRTRSRKAYSSGLSDDPSGAPVWTEYAAWASPGTSATTNSIVTYKSGNSTYKFRCATGITLSYSYNISTYDMHEVQIRVRVYSTQYDRASEWAYVTIPVVFQPRLTSCSAVTTARGGISVTWGTNWVRPCRLVLSNGLDERSGSVVGTWEGKREAQLDTTVEFAEDELVKGRNAIKGSAWVADARIISEDGAGYGYGADGGCSSIAYSGNKGYKVTPSAHTDASNVPVPTISVTTSSGEKAVLSINCNCYEVVARASWTDAEGVQFAGYLETGGSSPNWTATLDAPPLGTEITISIACCNNSGGYRNATKTLTISSDSHCHLDGDGDHLELKYDGDFQQSTTVTGESVLTAGRKFPVSRHGTTVTRSLRVKGTIAFPSALSFGDMELAALNVLDKPHDWLFRNPKGVRKHVRVTSWSTSQSTEQLGRVAEVTIDMEEVG